MVFSCQHLKLDKMFQGISDAFKTAADIVAPPPTLVQELEYHWKQVKKFYSNVDNSPRHISNTNIPHHLESILQTVLKEDIETDSLETPRDCMEFILNNRPLDLLLQLSISDNPPGIKICVLNWLRRFLSCIKEPPLEHASIFQPVRNFIRICNGRVPSPYEEEEILFLETVAGLIRKNPFLLDIFLSSHQHSASLNTSVKGTKIKKLPTCNPLFQCSKLETNIRRVEIIPDAYEPSTSVEEPDSIGQQEVENCDIIEVCNESLEHFYQSQINCDCEENERFYLLDAILSFLESPDSKIVVRACEGALILASLPTININCTSITASLGDFIDYLIQRICLLYEQIPDDMDADNIEEGNISWGLIPREPDDNNFVGKAQFHEFFCWLDYTDCVALESLRIEKFSDKFRTDFLLRYVEPTLLAADTPFVLILLSKIIRQIRSQRLMDEVANWLVGETSSELFSATDCLLTIIIENMQDNAEILLAGLQFIEALLDNPHEQILQEMLFRYINKRGYYDSQSHSLQSWSDEEDERERRRGSVDEQFKSRTLSPHNILKVINHFLLLLPRQIMSESGGTCYEEYVQDASRHYKIWTKKTDKFVWPKEAISPEREVTTSNPSMLHLDFSKSHKRSSSNENSGYCNDSGISEERFYEGPLLKLLFSHVRNMALQTCEINLAVIAILSKLAFLPHPYLHEILLNPEIPVAHGATTLWNNMQVVARQLLLEIPRHEHFQKRIGETGKRLLSNPPIICDEGYDDVEQLFEAIVILEEFCKELAAIAFVKYHHATE